MPHRTTNVEVMIAYAMAQGEITVLDSFPYAYTHYLDVRLPAATDSEVGDHSFARSLAGVLRSGWKGF